MKTLLIIFLAIGAAHCQTLPRCANKDDIAKIIATPPRKLDLEYLVNATETQAYSLNKILSRYKPDEYPTDPIPIQCSGAIIGNLFGDIDLHVDDETWEISESALQEYQSLEKSFAETTNSRVKRGLKKWFKKVVAGIKKIANTIAQVVQVVKKVVSFALTVISIIKDIKAIFGFFG